MTVIVRLGGGLVVLVAALASGSAPAPAHAGPAGAGLGLELRTVAPRYLPGEPIRLTLAVTNATGATCALATVADGTVRVTSVRRDGQDLVPALGRSFYGDGIAAAATAGPATVEPGGTATVSLVSVRTQDGADAGAVVLRSVAATPDGGGLDTRWPVGAPGRYEVTAAYTALPVTGLDDTCTGATALRTVSFTVGDGTPAAQRWWRWLLGGGVLVLVVGASAVLLRRGRRRPAAVTVALVLVGVGTVVGGTGRPARADYQVDPTSGVPVSGVDFPAAVAGCLQGFAAAGGDPAGILPRLRDAGTPRVRIVPTPGASGSFETPDSKDGKGSSTVAWNPTSVEPYGDGVARDPCAALYHELNHSDDISRDTVPKGDCGGTGIKAAEVKATLAENRYRAAKGLPPRIEYDGKALPKSFDECRKPAKKTPPPKGPVKLCEDGADCGGSNGDPHLVTFDRHYYDFQAVGEFVLVDATAGEPLAVQVRQGPMGDSRTVSVNTAVAVRIGAHRVALTLVDGATEVRVDDAVRVPSPGRTRLPGGGTLTRRGSDTGAADGYDLGWPDGSAVAVDQIGPYGYRVLAKLAPGRAGKVRGLLGDFDGDPADDVATPAGAPLAQPVPFGKLYPSYADGWRVTRDTSLFSYADGRDTGSFTDRDFPAKAVSVDDLDPSRRAQAEQVCRWAGVTDPWQLAECVLDVGVTGRPEFAVSGVGTERVAPPAAAPIAATPVATGALTPGGGPLAFPGRAGDAVFVDVTAPGLADGCSPYRLLDPTGTEVASGCQIAGRGHIDRTDLTGDGTYTVVVDASAGGTGRAAVRVYRVRDVTGTLRPDAPAVSAAIVDPGGRARYRFTGVAGQRVFVEVPESTLPDQCSPLELLGPQGTRLGGGCVVNGSGDVDGTVLPVDGTYTVLVDPVDRTVGTVALRLFVTRDRVDAITVDGPPVVADVDRPGVVRSYRFTGTAGTSVTVAATDATLPDQCSPVELRDAGGAVLGSGCVVNGVGGIAATVLPDSGVYTVVVDPSGAATGTVTLTLRR
ncbi:VWD domain-containing protein [Micromonospora sp. WMMD987]|uniref:VWD domain-containing protein n=1 Tax=Micromonospora sp. WMMD987 TaxID=3016089 RepID=UPI00249C6A80|nr:VWD domain-containing protein [Micromonospora sp. WMMD987]WFE93180.1 VWD domain-containing protein [Micromonospora sp. WMMD987]